MKYLISDDLDKDLSPDSFGYGLSANDIQLMSAEEIAAHGAKLLAEHVCKDRPSMQMQKDGL